MEEIRFAVVILFFSIQTVLNPGLAVPSFSAPRHPQQDYGWIPDSIPGSGKRLVHIRSLLHRSDLHQQKHHYEEALIDLASAAKLVRKTDSATIRFEIISRQGLMYYLLENYPMASDYFREIYDTSFSELNATQKCLLYNYLGLVHMSVNDYRNAETFLKKAKDESAKSNSPAVENRTTFNIGKLYFKQGQYARAWDLIMESLRRFQENEEDELAEEASRIMGMLYLEQENYPLAESFFKQSLELAREIGYPKVILENYKNLFTTYGLMREKNNNQQFLLQELEYFKRWAYLNDSLYQTQTAGRILELEKKYETEKKNSRIKLLEKEKQIANGQLKSGQLQRRYLFFLVMLILAVLGFFIYSFSYYKRMTHVLQRQSRRIMNQQARISSQNERLQKAVGAQNKLFSIIAHDLRSPLASLSNITKLITIYIDNKRYDQAAELSRQIDRKNDHLLELTDNLLDWTRSQSESFTPILERVKLSEVVVHCFKIYQPVSIDKEIALHYEQDGDCYLLADRNMLQTILRNLINNAIKFTPRKGRVQIICEQRQGFAGITVSDNGIGISRERMESIFEIDVKNIQNGTEGEKSTGLGLSVCKEFIEVMGGTIYAESRERIGTSFIFTIPLHAPLLQQGQLLSAPIPSAGSPGH